MRCQAAYYLLTGLWPVLHLPSFLMLTGRKRDYWLVRSTGLVIAAVGAGLAVASLTPRRARAMRPLGVIFPAALGAADVAYAWPATRSRAYLANAVVGAAFIAAWLAEGLSHRR